MTDDTREDAPEQRPKRGFAALDKERHREISSEGGKRSKAQGRGWNGRSAVQRVEDARAGGRASAQARRDKAAEVIDETEGE